MKIIFDFMLFTFLFTFIIIIGNELIDPFFIDYAQFQIKQRRINMQKFEFREKIVGFGKENDFRHIIFIIAN